MSGEETSEQSLSIVDRIRKLEKKMIESGELIQTPLATYHNSYLSDPRYLNSSVLDQISRLKLPELTRTEVGEVAKDLRLKGPLTIRRLIPTEDKANRIIIPALGIGGEAISDHEASLYFDPSHPHVVESLSLWAGREIAHELNHVARLQAKIQGRTLLDAFVFEGLATVYEEHYRNRYQPTPWGQALSIEQIVSEWQRAQQELNSTDYDREDWFFGHHHGHPVWTGYALGTAIVQSYVEHHPDESMSRLVRRPSVAILRKSGFLE